MEFTDTSHKRLLEKWKNLLEPNKIKKTSIIIESEEKWIYGNKKVEINDKNAKNAASD